MHCSIRKITFHFCYLKLINPSTSIVYIYYITEHVDLNWLNNNTNNKELFFQWYIYKPLSKVISRCLPQLIRIALIYQENKMFIQHIKIMVECLWTHGIEWRVANNISCDTIWSVFMWQDWLKIQFYLNGDFMVFLYFVSFLIKNELWI